MAKSVDKLTEKDFLAQPVWEFINDDKIEMDPTGLGFESIFWGREESAISVKTPLKAVGG